MEIWTATESRADGLYSIHFEAPNLREALAICDEEGWRLDGRLILLAPGDMDDDAMACMVDLMLEAEEATKH